jgi:hypothetical protein
MIFWGNVITSCSDIQFELSQRAADLDITPGKSRLIHVIAKLCSDRPIHSPN